MILALEEAKKAYKKGEVPIGAVIVKNGKVIAKGHNKKEKKHMTTRHAEIEVIEKASKKIRDWRLNSCEMYVTLEPCCMCAGAILNARLDKVYIGAMEKNYGCCGSAYNLQIAKSLQQKCKHKLALWKKKVWNYSSRFLNNIAKNR